MLTGQVVRQQALVARGWKEHREEDSMIFDLKWTIKTSDIAFKALNRSSSVRICTFVPVKQVN
jgi:hypothetical protein